MKATLYSGLFLFLPLLIFSQATREKSFEISIKVGYYYKFFLGNSYIKPSSPTSTFYYNWEQYARFNKLPTQGFQVGVLFQYNLKGHWFLGSGLIACPRKNAFEIDEDTLEEYVHLPSFPYISGVKRYDYTYYNLEIPVFFGYRVNKFEFSAGVYVPVLVYSHTKYTYLVRDNSSFYHVFTTDKTIEAFEYHFSVFPSIQAGYRININKFLLSPFIELDFGERVSIYAMGGIKIGLREF